LETGRSRFRYRIGSRAARRSLAIRLTTVS
jgi:hypothetical protein